MNPNPCVSRRSLLIGLCGACSLPAAAQSPDKPLRLILPMATGSVGDTVARGMAGPLGRGLNRPVVIDNITGAGGMTGTTQLVRAPADGSTLALVSSSHVINPAVYQAMPYDALRDVTPITVIGKSMMALVVHPAVPAQTLAEFVRLLKANPGKYNYGSSGNGGVTHLPAAMFNREAEVVTQHIPYKGLGQQVTDTIGGQVEFGVMPLGVAAPLIRSGKLRALGVTGTARSPLLPQVPTLIEAGLRFCVYEPWLAIIGPANLPPALVQGLYAEIHKALEHKELHALMEAQDLSPIGMPPAETAAYFQSESVKYAALAKFAGARVE